MPFDIALFFNKLTPITWLSIFIILSVMFAIVTGLVLRKRRFQKKVNTTALMNMRFGEQLAGRSAGQLQAHAKDYEIKEAVDEINKNKQQMVLNKTNLITMMDELKENYLKPEIKLEDKKIMIVQLKEKIQEVQNQLQTFYTPTNLLRLEQEEQKIIPEVRVAHLKTAGNIIKPAVMMEMTKAAEQDKHYYHGLVKELKTTAVTMPSFLSVMEKELGLIEKKLATIFASFKDQLFEAKSVEKETVRFSHHDKGEPEPPTPKRRMH